MPAPDALAPPPHDPRRRILIRTLVPPARRYAMRTRLLDVPGVSRVYTATHPELRSFAHVTRDTRIVIEGFPRSANSFARAAFCLANGEDGVCTNSHSAQTVLRALRYGVPVIVLIREPRAAIASGMQYTPGVTALTASRNYLRFYRRILPVVDRVVVADFAETVTNFGAVIRRCNLRYGTSFAAEHRVSDDAAVLATVDAWARAQFAPERVEMVTGRPSPLRRPVPDIVADFSCAELRALEEAEAVYRAVREVAVRSAPRPS